MAGAGSGAAAASGLLAVEICTPLLLLCWLCCWPEEANSDSTSGRHPQRPVLARIHDNGSHRRSSDFFGRRIGSSAVSLHLPGTSGYKKPLSAHRSHEEIGSRRKSTVDTNEQEARYHSAPSVIDEVLHRRDWERSSKELYIPLKPEKPKNDNASISSETSDVPPRAEPESSSIEDAKSDEQIFTKPCKKHHTNIKSSRGKKEKESNDIKDSDATEASSFYIGDNDGTEESLANEVVDLHAKSIYKAKEAKQSFNESIKTKERPRQTLVPLDEHQPRMFGFSLNDVIEQLDSLDRSGAIHHTIESRMSLSSRSAFPPPSVEPVGYDGGACYLAETGAVGELRGRGGAAGGRGERGEGEVRAGRSIRARHASDGDILAPHHRPESGAFSESDLDIELEGSEELPPAYDEVYNYTASDRKETAI